MIYHEENNFLPSLGIGDFFLCIEWQVLEEPVPSIHGCELVVRLQIGSLGFPSELQNRTIPPLTRAGLVFDAFGIESVKESQSQQSIGRALSKSPSLLH